LLKPKDSTSINANGASITTHANGVPKIVLSIVGELAVAIATTPVSARAEAI